MRLRLVASPAKRVPWQERFEELKLFVEVYERLPKVTSADPIERALALYLSVGCCPNNKGYLPEVAAWRENYSPKKDYKSWQEFFSLCQEFVKTHGRLPSKKSEESYEKRLGFFLCRVCDPSHGTFKREIRDWKNATKLELRRKKHLEPTKPDPLFVPKVEYKKEWGD